MSSPIVPGTVLAGRYRLDDLLTESEGARFWRATDTILARSVAIHAVASDDPRSDGLMEAARVSATVIDPHLLRVLDCDDEDGITWVVNEWGEGISLDLMLEHGTLPPSRAAWLTREVAEAIAAGHAQGVAHGRLNPEAVLVTNAGAVKLIGYVVDASLETPRPPDPRYGELDDREADVINLAGILYAALTGRWPGVVHSSVPSAPLESRRPLRPRQVRAGVPRTLDAICERVLHKEASRHALPIETAHEIAAALADYVGDPMLAAPVDAAGMHAEPTLAIHRDDLPSAPVDLGSWAPDPEGTEVSAPVVPDSEATQTFSAPEPADSEGPDTLSPMQARTDDDGPPSPFPEVPERPLYASTERRVPESARDAQDPSGSGSGSSTAAGEMHAGTDGGRVEDGDTEGAGPGQAGFWPFDTAPEEESETHTGREGRGWLRVAVVVGVVLVVVIAMLIAFNRGRQTGSPSRGSGEPSSTSQPSQAPVKLAGVRDFDPFANPPEENPDTAPNAIDGNPATTWRTSTYRGNPALGGLKSGVGLMVDLGKETKVASVTVTFKGAPTSFEVYAAPAGVTESPGSLDQLDKVASRAGAPERVTVSLDSSPRTRYLLVWLTKLPAVSGGYRGEIAEIAVRP